MAEIMRFAPAGSTVLLCRIFRDTVLCDRRRVLGSLSYVIPVAEERAATRLAAIAAAGAREIEAGMWTSSSPGRQAARGKAA